MASYLFTWKQEHYPALFDDYQKWLDGTEKILNWSAGKFDDIPAESRVFIMRQGKEPGIIGAGRTISGCRPRPHGDGTPGKLENANDIELDDFVSPGKPLVSLDELLAIDNQRHGLWLYGSSGKTIPDDTAAKLEKIWNKAVQRAGIARTGEVPELKTIRNVDDLAENFTTFQREARYNRSRSARILSATKYWVKDDNSPAFAPSKFLGFRGMSFRLYETAKTGKTKGYDFQGKITRQAIERVVGQEFQADADLIEDCRRWGEEYFGRGAFGGADGQKWEFIRFAIPGRESNSLYPDEITQPERRTEGALLIVTVNGYERNSKARQDCIDFYKPICQVCNLKFFERYGKIGRDFIHVHHLIPLAKIAKEYQVNGVKDLRPVCPNCHAMLHREEPPLTIAQLKEMLRPLKIS